MEQTVRVERSIAYFSMEIGLNEKIQTYSGGLGVLVGDTIRSAADLRVSMVAVTLLYRKGYFRQKLDADGWQREEPAAWPSRTFWKRCPSEPRLPWKGEPFISGSEDTRSRELAILRCRFSFWILISRKILSRDQNTHSFPLWRRSTLSSLSGSDHRDRWCEDAPGSSDMTGIERFHMNEGALKPPHPGAFG